MKHADPQVLTIPPMGQLQVVAVAVTWRGVLRTVSYSRCAVITTHSQAS
jgi:hypothetical protein